VEDTTRLRPLVDTWRTMVGDAAVGTTTLTWMPGERFLVPSWTVDVAGPPSGLAVIGPDGHAFVQHYFDERGVARRYALDLADGVLTLERPATDDPGAGFAQRFEGRFALDGGRIDGAWYIEDDGRWRVDFELAYVRAG